MTRNSRARLTSSPPDINRLRSIPLSGGSAAFSKTRFDAITAGEIRHLMIELILLPAFDTWFHGLRDRVARKRISAWLARLATVTPAMSGRSVKGKRQHRPRPRLQGDLRASRG